MPPADMVSISITSGYTSETPASASGPSHPTKTASMVVTTACSTITSTLGAASQSRVEATGASRSRRVRAAMDGKLATGLATTAVEVITCKIIVTCFFVKPSLPWRHAEDLRATLPGGQDPRSGGRSLDAPRGARSPWRRPPLPRPPNRPSRPGPQHPVRATQAHGGARPGEPALLLRPSAAGPVRADGQGARARDGGRRPRGLGNPSRGQGGSPRPRRLGEGSSARLLPR